MPCLDSKRAPSPLWALLLLCLVPSAPVVRAQQTAQPAPQQPREEVVRVDSEL